ncbi:UTRA domain-containing protein [Frateuria aurantia]
MTQASEADRISDIILREIDHQVWSADQPLSVERLLASRFNCTRITLREALQQLESQGRVYRENRRGWFVSPPRLRYSPANIDGFMQYAASQGRSPRTELLGAEVRAAGPAFAESMGLSDPDTPVVVLKRRRWLGRRAVLFEINVLLASWCPGLLKHDLEGSLSVIFNQHMGLRMSHSDMRMHAGSLAAEPAQSLFGRRGMPCIQIQRVSYARKGQAVELDCEYWRADALEIVVSSQDQSL